MANCILDLYFWISQRYPRILTISHITWIGLSRIVSKTEMLMKFLVIVLFAKCSLGHHCYQLKIIFIANLSFKYISLVDPQSNLKTVCTHHNSLYCNMNKYIMICPVMYYNKANVFTRKYFLTKVILKRQNIIWYLDANL